MEIHTFVAESADDALAQIRERLGPQAVVLNVRPLPAEGVFRLWQRPRMEVLAHLPQKSAGVAEANSHWDRVKEEDAPVGDPPRKPELASRITSDRLGGVASSSAAPGPPQRKPEWRMNSFLEESGLLPVFSGRVLQEAQARFGEFPPRTIADEIGLAQSVLVETWQSRLRPNTKASTHVFVGAAGSGKTTCLCKWLARTVLSEGRPAEVWRLDGHVANTAESLSIYCEILGAPLRRYVPPRRDPGDDTIFIDLPGVNPKDSSSLEGLQYFVEELPHAQVHLVLNAAYDTRLLLGQARAFSSLRISDLIFTHLDEEQRWGKLWNFVLGTNYSIRCLSSGQNIPGEFMEATAESILAQQFRRE